ncbi:glyoxylase [Enterococcus haemoperoxidus ATCC BAA-382]|uniref:Glyoxylase n=1 Tax=Enterococcus haemoperoxidus ATCC BAA-382 TaxID=1158608 RepID=R2SBU7_9ENTE|nr:VOC family protein [Enterococcus haemoperoxidus]EOH92975.1 glyoxylase [Enterococcus haemoperoxidus ATCC BAA-382]EOT61429.1 glyoxylase [Enterococcus haemoperoxidus ATCC BAA-382]OJG55262.1 glyoxylase [Enterococcus haemoperoxidus]
MKLDMVGIIVESMEQAILFYERLGFEVLGEKKADYVEVDNKGMRISLNTKKMIEGIYGYPPKSEGDKIELAFLCDSPREIDQLCEKMKGFGYDIFREPWQAFWGQYYAIIKDPDGNLLSLFCNDQKEQVDEK